MTVDDRHGVGNRQIAAGGMRSRLAAHSAISYPKLLSRSRLSSRSRSERGSASSRSTTGRDKGDFMAEHVNARCSLKVIRSPSKGIRTRSCPAPTVPSLRTRRYAPGRPASRNFLAKPGSLIRAASVAHGVRDAETLCLLHSKPASRPPPRQMWGGVLPVSYREVIQIAHLPPLRGDALSH